MTRRVAAFAAIIVLATGAWVVAVVWRVGRPLLPPVPADDREIVWIHAATSAATWERFVSGVHLLNRDWPGLRIDDQNAVLDETTAVPEIVLSMEGIPGRLRIRWCKLSQGANFAWWGEQLSHRNPPPLAVIGGGSSDRAFDLAKTLAAVPSWRGHPPLFLITTATASTVQDEATNMPRPLMEVYPHRSFRFCFTNEQMARAVVDFVWSQPDLKPHGDPLPALGAILSATDHPLATIAPWAVQDIEFPPSVSALEWDDDPYSVDLSRQFRQAFHQPGLGRVLVRETRSIPFSIGGLYSPNAWEAEAADRLLANLARSPLERQLLVLPTVANSARRVLRSITAGLPLAGRSLVAVTGDSININNVYRDADITWNVRALAVPLVFFAHQNPVDWDRPGENEDPLWGLGLSRGDDRRDLLPPSGTDDVLNYRDMMRRVVEAAFNVVRKATPTSSAESARLADNSNELARRLRDQRPGFFDADGDRTGGVGEFVLCLRPRIESELGSTFGQIRPGATLEVWTRQAARGSALGAGSARPIPQWQPVKRLNIHGSNAFHGY